MTNNIHIPYHVQHFRGTVDLGKCMPLKAALINKASDKSVKSGKAVTVLTYLHGVKEANLSIDELEQKGLEIDLIELRTLKPLNMDTIRESLERTNKLCILDESTKRWSWSYHQF